MKTKGGRRRLRSGSAQAAELKCAPIWARLSEPECFIIVKRVRKKEGGRGGDMPHSEKRFWF